MDADVGSQSDDFPLEAAARMLPAEADTLAHSEVYDQNVASLVETSLDV